MDEQSVIAVDVALLLPDEVAALAVRINREFPAGEAEDLILDDDHLPHLTLVQQFVQGSRLNGLIGEVEAIVSRKPALRLDVSGLEKLGSTVVLAVSRTPELQRLHGALMEALAGFEKGLGGHESFHSNGKGPRERDVQYVTNFRARSAFDNYSPHITLGHGETSTRVEAFSFDADHVAVCHLGRFCTCRIVFADWKLSSNIR
jgi:2'-5' RNA ligase